MAKEEELKKVDLKVNVSCCEGCRRKVMKAMSLKGVLNTEIHPSLDMVTVVGNVDSRVLVKKLAKIGKIAEVVAPPPLPCEENKKRCEDSGGKDSDKPAPADEKSKRKDDGKDTGDKAAAASSKQECKKCTQKGAARADDTDHANGKAPSKDAAAAKSIDEGVGPNSSVPDNAAMYHHYHRAEPPMVVPVHMPYYPANATTYYGSYYAMPPPLMPQRPPQLRPQPSRFDEDFFNDDNTVGCRVM